MTKFENTMEEDNKIKIVNYVTFAKKKMLNTQ